MTNWTSNVTVRMSRAAWAVTLLTALLFFEVGCQTIPKTPGTEFAVVRYVDVWSLAELNPEMELDLFPGIADAVHDAVLQELQRKGYVVRKHGQVVDNDWRWHLATSSYSDMVRKQYVDLTIGPDVEAAILVVAHTWHSRLVDDPWQHGHSSADHYAGGVVGKARASGELTQLAFGVYALSADLRRILLGGFAHSYRGTREDIPRGKGWVTVRWAFTEAQEDFVRRSVASGFANFPTIK